MAGDWLHHYSVGGSRPRAQSRFLRGYRNLKIVRTLSISHGDGSPHVWRNIHQSQERLSDEELVSASCIVTSDFAVVQQWPNSVVPVLADAIPVKAPANGVVGAVVYAIHGDDFDSRPVHIGDTYSAGPHGKSCSG